MQNYALDDLKYQSHLVKGDADVVISELVSEKQADLLVMGTIARTGIPGVIVGNTAERLLPQIPCSVLAVKPADFKSPITLESENDDRRNL